MEIEQPVHTRRKTCGHEERLLINWAQKPDKIGAKHRGKLGESASCTGAPGRGVHWQGGGGGGTFCVPRWGPIGVGAGGLLSKNSGATQLDPRTLSVVSTP